jgi:hypothetical protein
MKYVILTFLGFLAFQSNAQDNIADVRNNFNVGQTVTISGIITNGAELGPVRYIQDESGGIALYPGSNWNGQDFDPQPGDIISITGVITEFASLLEIGPNISSMELISSGNELPEPIALTPSQVDEQYEGMLSSFTAAEFAEGGAVFGVSTYNFNSAGEQGVIYVPSGSPILGELVPLGTVDLVGIVSQYSNSNPNVGYQILPRTYDDFVFSNAINITSQIEQTNLSISGFDLSWSTDLASSSQVEYGTNPELGTIITGAGNVADHMVELTGLESGTPYFCQVFSVVGDDTIRSSIGVYSTVSESSGEMRAYFNNSVDTEYATFEEALGLFDATDDTIIAAIDRAMTTLDIAVYNNNSAPIVTAINDAYDRGVDIRYITEGQTANSALNNLNPNIQVLDRLGAISSGMHNKFLIVDRDNVDSALVLTGSTNWTSNNLFSDPNNMVIIHDQALARAYTLEFNEMWGGEGLEPNLALSKFGEFKTNNTPEKFIIGGVDVELYFSPSDNTTIHIAEAIETTDYDLHFALLLITNNVLTDAILDQVSLFVQPKGIVESVNINGSDVDELVANGVEICPHTNAGQLHHKYAFIDESEPLSDPIVVTGSHNWSSSAESSNDENTLIIHDARIANLFLQEWMARYAECTLRVEEQLELPLKLFPNPAQSEVQLLLDMNAGTVIELSIVDTHGRVINREQLRASSGSNLFSVDVSELPNGIYILVLDSDQGNSYQKLVVNH